MSSTSPAGFWIRTAAFAWDTLPMALYLGLVVGLGAAFHPAFPSAARAIFGNPLSGQLAGLVTVTLPITLYFALSESDDAVDRAGAEGARGPLPAGRDGHDRSAVDVPGADAARVRAQVSDRA